MPYKELVLPVTPDRTKSIRQLVSEVRCAKYIDEESLKAIPIDLRLMSGIQQEVVMFFSDKRVERRKALLQRYARRKLIVADVHLIIQANIENPGLSAKYPNCTQWLDTDGYWTFCAFRSGPLGPVMYLHRNRGFSNEWWFAGMRR